MNHDRSSSCSQMRFTFKRTFPLAIPMETGEILRKLRGTYIPGLLTFETNTRYFKR